MSLLTPNNYKKDVKWKLNSKEKVDSVVFDPILNDITTQTLYSESIGYSNNVIKINDTITSFYNLYRDYDYSYDPQDPIPFYPHIMHTAHNEGIESYGSNYEKAKGRVGVVYGVYEKTITLSSPLSGSNLTVNLSFNYKTDSVSRGSRTVSNMPSWANLNNRQWSLTRWIQQNKSLSEDDSPKWIWNASIFPLNPFVRIPTRYNADIVLPDSSEVLTRWYTGAAQYPSSGSWNAGAKFMDWTDYTKVAATKYNNLFTKENKDRYFQDIEYGDDDSGDIQMTPYLGFRCLNIENLSLLTKVNYELVDTTHVKLKIEFPVRIEYCAASLGWTGILHATETQIDNYAFVDNVSAMSITVQGATVSSESSQLIYELNSSNNAVLTDTKSDFDYVISKNDLITVDAYFKDSTNIVLTKKLAEDILRAYKKSKMTFECTVDAEWAIENGIELNNYLNVYDSDNKLIRRNNHRTAFIVKNIIKVYEKGFYYYKIGLLESLEDVGIISVKTTDGKYYQKVLRDNNNLLSSILQEFDLQRQDISSIIVSGNKSIFLNRLDGNNPYFNVKNLNTTGSSGVSIDQIAFATLTNAIININGVNVGTMAFYNSTIEKVFIDYNTILAADNIFYYATVKELWFDGDYQDFQEAYGLAGNNSWPDTGRTIIYIKDENNNWIRLN